MPDTKLKYHMNNLKSKYFIPPHASYHIWTKLWHNFKKFKTFTFIDTIVIKPLRVSELYLFWTLEPTLLFFRCIFSASGISHHRRKKDPICRLLLLIIGYLFLRPQGLGWNLTLRSSISWIYLDDASPALFWVMDLLSGAMALPQLDDGGLCLWNESRVQ